MKRNYWSKLLIEYIANFLYKLDGKPFEYYYLNKSYPHCTIDNLSDEEIAKQYPLSGERLILDCLSISEEFSKFTPEDYASLIRIIDVIVKDTKELL